MHYKNLREAKQGDKVVSLIYGIAGILHNINSQSDTCNGRLAIPTPNDAYVTIKECLHIDDVIKAEVPDSTKQ